MRFALNQLCRRQTADSRFSHFAGSEADLLALVSAYFDSRTPGYTDGVWLVPVPPERFFSGVVRVTEGMELKAQFTARAKGEQPYIDVVAVGGEKLPAQTVNLVLYSHALLGNDATTDAEFEVVSINASAETGTEPLTPMAMARNFLNLPGGTAATYTAEEFAKSIAYWSQRAMRG